jgi:hypothetical protein
MTAKMYQFPQRGRYAPSLDPGCIVIKPDAAQMAQDHCDSAIQSCLDEIGFVLDDAGLQATRERFVNDEALLLEMILESMVYKMAGLKHPLHGVMNELIDISKEGYETNGYHTGE